MTVQFFNQLDLEPHRRNCEEIADRHRKGDDNTAWLSEWGRTVRDLMLHG